jgi:hypothetical protein
LFFLFLSSEDAVSVANTALLYNLGLEGFAVTDDLVAGPAAARATACRLPSQLNRVVSSVASGCLALPSIISGEAAWVVFVVNDSANAVLVGAAAPGGGGASQETINGAATTSNYGAGTLSIPAGQSGIFVPVPNGKGGTLDWRSAVIP